MTRIVVTGGRNYGLVPPHTPLSEYVKAKECADRERARFEQVMAAAVPRLGLTEIACGRCRTGADELAVRWAKKNLPSDKFVGFPPTGSGSETAPDLNAMAECSAPSAPTR